MPDKRKYGDEHINKSIKQIDASTWLIGDFILRRSLILSDEATWTDDSDHSSYTLTKRVSGESFASVTTLDTPHMKLIHEAGDASAVWTIGSNVFCKVRYIEDGVTPESVTLRFVQGKKPSFETPRVLAHIFSGDISFLILTRVPGRTLDVAWPTLDDYWRRFYVNALVDACEEMAQWTGDQVGGVDKQFLSEWFLTRNGRDDFGMIPATCEAIGMDCSTVHFFHADLGPTNIIVEDEPTSGRLGIIDFEIAGYFPRKWILTKFRISAGMDLSPSACASSDCPSTWWRAEVVKALRNRGFEDSVDAWQKWRASSQ